jgi:hypothetical protein
VVTFAGGIAVRISSGIDSVPIVLPLGPTNGTSRPVTTRVPTVWVNEGGLLSCPAQLEKSPARKTRGTARIETAALTTRVYYPLHTRPTRYGS